MNYKEIKQFVGDKIKEKGLNLAEVSRMLGKQDSYMYSFVARESPKRLGEFERALLARMLEVDEQELSDRPLGNLNYMTERVVQSISNSVTIDILDVVACCGDGADVTQEPIIGIWTIPRKEYKNYTNADPNDVKMIRATGDSMQPTINDGDWILVDTSFKTPTTDGIFIIRMANGLAIKRIQASLSGFIVRSDNPQYKDIEASSGELVVLGKVICYMNTHRC